MAGRNHWSRRAQSMFQFITNLFSKPESTDVSINQTLCIIIRKQNFCISYDVVVIKKLHLIQLLLVVDGFELGLCLTATAGPLIKAKLVRVCVEKASRCTRCVFWMQVRVCINNIKACARRRLPLAWKKNRPKLRRG